MSTLFLALGLSLAPTASALPSVDGTWPKTTQRHPEDAAVVVGIEDYGTLPDTPYAVNDAVGFRRYLLVARGLSNRRIHIKTRQGEDAPHVTAGEIEQLVRKAALEAGPKGTVWVYFSGHGFVMDGERLLLDSEARQDAMRARAVTDTQLREWASSEGSKVVLVVDACYNGQLRGGGELFAGARSIVGPSFALPVEAASVDWVAAQPNQRAYPLAAAEHGAFTYHLLGALRGWADGELDGQRDGEVTAAEADAYVVRMFEDQGSQAKGQMPELSTASAGSWVFSTATEAAPLVVVEASDVQAAMAKVERPGEVIGKLGYKMVRIQPGTFTMGSPSTERGRDSDETQHQVTLTRAFLMGTTEVTQGLYGSVMGSNPSRFSSCGPRCPVEQVSWFDAMRFANKLSEREGLVPVYQLRVEEVTPNWSANGYRLPPTRSGSVILGIRQCPVID